jgi:3-oxoacyl-[acyl-carrier protein] reductase
VQISLGGRKALVTGGTRGIGREITRQLALAGADVIACYRTPGEHVDELARELKEIPGDHHLIQADISDEAEIAALVQDTNLTGAFLVAQGVLPLLDKGSSIINIGSRVATVGIPLRAHYTAAKAGMIGLTRSMCKELGGRGIRVNLVAPGVIDTVEDLPAEIHARYEAMTALRRLGQPAEIASVVCFLASDLATYITGETIHVDGGI